MGDKNNNFHIDNRRRLEYILTVLIELIQLGKGRIMILLDYKDRRPVYEQVVEKFQQMILCGALQQGEAMPSVRSLAMELSVNPNTVQRAYQELERAGYIYSIKGKGSFVSSTLDAAASKRKELFEELKGCVGKALAAGITEKELREMLTTCIQDLRGTQQGGGVV